MSIASLRRKHQAFGYNLLGVAGIKNIRHLAIFQRGGFLYIIIDDADQVAFWVPKLITNTNRYKRHIMKLIMKNVLKHSVTNLLSMFKKTQEKEIGESHIIEVVNRVFMALLENGELQPGLWLRLENYMTENNNTITFSYLQICIFDEIIVGFIPFGHTNEDFDHSFRTTSSWLRSKNAMNFIQLL